MTAQRDPFERGEKRGILHAGFEIGIFLKGMHALLELVSGLLLSFISPEFLSTSLRMLTKSSLAKNSHDSLAILILTAGEHYSIGTQHFGVFYLLSHGAIKIVLVLLLWRKKLWAYPLAIGVMVLFIGYQMFRWTTTHSAFLVALSVFDAIMIWLTIVEYKRITTAEGISRAPPSR